MRRGGLSWSDRLTVLAAASALALVGTVTATQDANAALVPTADLAVVTAGAPDPVGPGRQLTYTISVTNAGPDSASNVVLSDVVPGSTTIVSLSSPSGWTCVSPASGGTGTVTCSLSTLPAWGAPHVFALVVKVNSGTSEGTTISDTAAVASATIDAKQANNRATVTTTVRTPVADLSATKSDRPAPVIAGRDLTYKLIIANAGPNGAESVWVSDDVPANTTFVSLAQTSGPIFSCDTPPAGGTGTVRCSIATLGSGASARFSLVVNVNADTSDGTFICNTVTVASPTNDPNSENNSDTEKTEVKTVADLSATKADDPDPVTAGDDLTYTLTIANAGPNGAQSVWVSDEIPANTTFVSLAQTSGPTFSCSTPPVGGTGTIGCGRVSLWSGASATLRLVVNVNADTPDGTLICNTVTVTSRTDDPNTGNNSATAKTLVKTAADLSATKSEKPDPVTAGDNLTYKLKIANAGPNAAQSVWVSDTIPANTTFVSFTQNSGPTFSCGAPPVGGTGTVGCSASSLVAGARATFTLVVRVNADTPDGTLICNTVSVESSTNDPNTGNNSDTEKTQVKTAADVSVTKADDVDPVTAGDDVTYTLIVNNAGPSDAQSVAVRDPIPANTTFVSLMQNGGPAFTCIAPAVGGPGTVTCTIATLAAGATASFSLVVNVNANTPDGSVISNTVTATSTTSDPVPGNNSATQTTTVSAAPPPPPSANLSVTKADAPDPIVAGNNLTYTLTLTNAGPSDAQNVVLSDTLPEHTTFVSFAQTSGSPMFTLTSPSGGTGTVTASAGTFAAGATATFTLVVNVNADTAEGTVISNTVTATSTTSDPVPGNNSATATTQVHSVPPPPPP
jgi:uncharacterized repeat protein (TIGR01451 family)